MKEEIEEEETTKEETTNIITDCDIMSDYEVTQESDMPMQMEVSYLTGQMIFPSDACFEKNKHQEKEVRVDSAEDAFGITEFYNELTILKRAKRIQRNRKEKAIRQSLESYISNYDEPEYNSLTADIRELIG